MIEQPRLGAEDYIREEPTRWNQRFTQALLLVGAMTIGLLPSFFFLGHPEWLLVFVTLVGVWKLWLPYEDFMSPMSLQGSKSTGSKLSLSEYILAIVAGASSPAMAGVFSLLIYAILYWGAVLLPFLLRLGGLTVQLNASAIAFYTTTLVLFLASLVILPAVVRQLRRTLYTGTPGTRSTVYPLVAQGLTTVLTRTLAVILPVIATLDLFIAGIDLQWPYAVLQVVIMFGALVTLEPAIRYLRTPEPNEVLEIIAKLFTVAGYYVTLEPKSETMEDLGPLLSSVDLIAENSRQAFVIDVTLATEPASEVLERVRASRLQSTAWVVSHYKERLGIRANIILPLVIFFGRKADPAITMFANDQGIVLLEVDEHTSASLSDSAQLKQVAHDLLEPLRESTNRAYRNYRKGGQEH